MNSIVVGIFDSQAEAAQARTQLMAAGFAANAITATGDTASPASTTSAAVDASDQPKRQGTISRFFHSLFGSDDAADRNAQGLTYQEAFRRGAYGVSVAVSTDAEAEMSGRILDEAGAIDVDERSAQWRQEGWLAGNSTADQVDLKAGDTQALQEVEEELKVGKRAVARGGVRIFTRVTEVPVEESVSLREEHASVQRHAVDRPATGADLAGFKEGSIEVREMAEEAVVSKTARVVSEVEIGKNVTEHEEAIHDTVRKTAVEVENLEPGTPTPTSYAKGKTSPRGTPPSH